jgi:glycerophosphoryl diester phosphodiesterase
MVSSVGMKMRLALSVLAIVIALPVPVAAQSASPIIIAHRGASGERPEHTLAAYQLAIEQGADFIEPDLVPTKDGVLIARHENEISGTTDVADHPEFADRLTTRNIDGVNVRGWFTEDFTLAELKTLRAKERLPELRPENAAYDGQFEVPTLAEVIDLVRAAEVETGRTIGLYPELKHPTYFARAGFDMEGTLIAELEAAGYDRAEDAVFIQSFERGLFCRMNEQTDLRLVQLLAAEGAPADAPVLSYEMLTGTNWLASMATCVDAIGADMRLILNPDGSPTPLVSDAHAAGLEVHAWTLRRENAFMPDTLKSNDNPSGVGGLPPLMGLLVAAGVDGILTDHPGAAVMLRDSGDYAP